jgi:hypothetical protein
LPQDEEILTFPVECGRGFGSDTAVFSWGRYRFGKGREKLLTAKTAKNGREGREGNPVRTYRGLAIDSLGADSFRLFQ